MRSTGPSPATRAAVIAREGGCCARCGRPCEGTWPSPALHHRRPRAAGGSRRQDTNTPANLVLVDDACHRWIENNRHRALLDGWLVRQTASPEDCPVLYRSRWVLLHPDGSLAPIKESA